MKKTVTIMMRGLFVMLLCFLGTNVNVVGQLAKPVSSVPVAFYLKDLPVQGKALSMDADDLMTAQVGDWQGNKLGSSVGRSFSTVQPAAMDMDIYLLIGQSNMAGRGDMVAAAMEPLDNVYLLNADNAWELAKNPLNRYSTVRKDIAMQKLGPGYTFGRKLAEKTGKNIGLVVNARGGTAIQRWQKGYEGPEDYDMYEEAVARARQAMQTGTLRGIIWHQGEANRSMGPEYLQQLKQLVSDLRTDLGGDLVVVVGELGHWRLKSDDFNAILHGVSEVIDKVYVVRADELTPLKGDLSDPHFDGASQRILGERYADKIIEVLYKTSIDPQ